MKLRPKPKYLQLELNFNENAISIQKKNLTENGTESRGLSRKQKL